MNPILKSYLRAVAVAVLPLLAASNSEWRHYFYAILIAVLAPLARAADPSDKAFGYGKEENNSSTP
jgi:hypothetical protein